MSSDIPQLAEQLRNGSTSALARVVSLIEEGGPSADECLRLLFPHTGSCKIIGVTGSPGAGKSTLVDQMVLGLSALDAKVGVIAVDPSSPFTGGALLGDRIRMSAALEKTDVFVRSMATRGALGGLSPKTADAIHAFDAAGFDYVIVETVGVGQAEVEIVKTADTVIVVLVPGMGDSVQALKAGILEIADIFAINKADYSAAPKLKRELKALLALAPKSDWEPSIVLTTATRGQGIDELLSEVRNHGDWASQSGTAERRRSAFYREHLCRTISAKLTADLTEFALKENLLEAAVSGLVARKQDPSTAADELITAFLRASKNEPGIGFRGVGERDKGGKPRPKKYK